MIRYARLTFNVPTSDGGTRRRTAWVKCLGERNGLVYYSVVTRDGDPTGEIIIAIPADVVGETPARMNLTYAELEIVK